MSTRNKQLLGLCLLLAIVTVAAFWPVISCGFVNYDDPVYLSMPQAQNGLTMFGARWAITATADSNWAPLVWMSLMLDRSLYGDSAAGYHVTNLLFHLLTTILLFLLLYRMTSRLSSTQSGALWRSGLVAALFGIHPLHVESVAWVVQRKDVLSTFFMMLTLWAYVAYTDRPTLGRRLWPLLPFAIGLTAKAMLVTMPFMLLLLDFWPLGRFRKPKNGTSATKRLILEKLPYAGLSAAACVITILSQHKAIAPLSNLPLPLRLENSLVSYVGYLLKTAWPAKLAFFYPYPNAFPIWQVVGSALLLAAVTVIAFRKIGNAPYFTMGWLWYLVTLVPVIDLVQFGSHGMADRYTYVPLIGIFIAIVWAVPDLPRARRPLMALAGVILLILGMATWRQAGYWHDSESLSRHAIAVTKDNYKAYCILGVALTQQGNPEEAAEQFIKAIQIKPDSAELHVGLGNAFSHEGEYDKAVSEYEIALTLEPDNSLAHHNLALVQAAIGGERGGGEAGRQRSTQPGPQTAEEHFRLGFILMNAGRIDEAMAEYVKGLRLKPDYAPAHNDLAIAHFVRGEYLDAWKEVHLCRKYGAEPPAEFIKALSAKQPDPQP